MANTKIKKHCMLKLNQSTCLRHDNFFYQKNLAITRVNTLVLMPRRVCCCVDTGVKNGVGNAVKKKCLFPYLFLDSNQNDSTVSLIKDPLIPGCSYNKNVLRFDESSLVVCIDTEYNKQRVFTIQVNQSFILKIATTLAMLE